MDSQCSPTVRRVVGPTILLQSGEYFDFCAPQDAVFGIEDIAHGLSMVCRFAGHTSRFYSVAEHCVHASRHVAPEFAFEALMHDAAEAFIGDVTKPLKDLLPDYRALEGRIETAVLGRFGLTLPMSDAVHEVDMAMLVTEQHQLMRNRDDWQYARGRSPLNLELPCWTPEQAKAEFLVRFKELT
jgi:uncharacterized protein